MKNLIVQDDYFELINPDVKKIILDISRSAEELYTSNAVWSEYLKRYLLLTYGGSRIPKLTTEVLFTSRYYLLKKFYHFYSLENGEDAGFIQLIGKLIEEFCNKLPNYDWSILENISININEECTNKN